MTHSSRFWDRIAKRYSRQLIADDASYQHKLELTRKYLDPSMDLLEVGCGTGGTARLHAPRVRSIHAIDFSEKMIAIGRERAAAEGIDNVSFEVGSLEDLDAPGRYDMVLALSLLHLVPDLDGALAALVRSVKPGGLVVSSTACLAEHHGFLRYLGPIGRGLRIFPFFAVFSVDQLQKAVERAGLVIEEFWMPGTRRAHVAFIIARRPTV